MKLSEIKQITAEELIASIKNGRFTLDGSELKINGDFKCVDKQLISLEGAPGWVGGDFSCSYNRLVSLEGAPKEVGGSFYCSINLLTTLEGAPMVVNGGFLCIGNKLTSLKDIHKHIKKINGVFDVTKNPIRSHVLGLLLIQKLKRVEMDNKNVERILNRHLPNNHGAATVINVQSELLDAGLEEYAQL